MSSIKQLVILLSAIFVVALGLRLVMVNDTLVSAPLSADAGQYYLYTVNLQHFGVYSRSENLIHESTKSLVPKPDSDRTPGYSIFLYPFIEFPPTKAMFDRIVKTQAIVSAITVLVAFLFFQSFLSWWGALIASLLTAISPHLVAMNIYVLTETLFTFFLVSFAYTLSRLAKQQNKKWAILSGLLLGFTMLVKPTLSYFLLLFIPALFIFFSAKKAIKIGFLIVLGCYIVYGPWVLRNAISVEDSAKSSKALASIHKGMYPNIMYKNNPESFGYPNKYDPGWKTRGDLKSVIREIGNRFSEEPLRHLHWYLAGKPMVFLSWSIVVGMGDVFIYAVETSPYQTSKILYFSHRMMYWLHWPLTALAIFALIIAWMPSAGRYLLKHEVLITKFCSIMIVYFLLVHIIGLPLPRYAIPIRPIIFGMSILGLSILTFLVKTRLNKHSVESL